ncbi:unnamed protein product [Oikopleura dioica]|uniref:Trehalase n=1 Tax=Oikopleura dioica TaxID=34765 RepID=E4XAZ4_OIKDI|nr:unnamed protein product [Oikopleura dioica]
MAKERLLAQNKKIHFMGEIRETQDVYPCDSKIFCQGEFLDAVQNARIFEESKEFVDMKIKNGLDEEIILAEFGKMQNPSVEEIRSFVASHFDQTGSDSPEMREFGENVHKIWPQLGRKVKRDVAENNELYSFIPLNYTTVVPTGHDGRFREMYYWDSYWHIRGLLVSEAYQVVFELLNNFKSLVERFGFIPNGTRKYYTTRSQPPFYSTAVHDFYEHCKANPEATNVINMTCEKILEYFLPSMEAELKWWLQNRKIELENGDFGFAYGCPITVPRPEAYLDDKKVLDEIQDSEERRQKARDITSAAESGWDFSSRWVPPGVYNDELKGKVTSLLETTKVLPVDLNSIILNSAVILENLTKKDEYKALKESLMKTIESYMFDAENSTFNDYWFESEIKHSDKFFSSDFVPLYFKNYPASIDADSRDKAMMESMKKQGVLDFQFGIPQSLDESDEQWDFPNAWPPSVHMIIMGLAKSGSEECRQEAKIQAEKWVNANRDAFVKFGQMFEKMNVEKGSPGEGGEYIVQTGFGWSNGVVLDFLYEFGEDLQVSASSTKSNISKMLTTSLLMLFFFL